MVKNKIKKYNHLIKIVFFLFKIKFLGDPYKDIMNADIVAACTKKLADNFFKLKYNK